MAAKRTRKTAPPEFESLDPYESARAAGLKYVSDERPGIVRKKAGNDFTYIAPDGKTVTSEEDLSRIASLVIPPAWTDVWICPNSTGHLQAVGRDAKGRKQYRYHPLYRQVRDQNKFSRMIAFGTALPLIRKRVEHDLKLPGFQKNKVLATVVRLLETTCIRVGNEEYVKQNESFGLTTMRNRHVKIEGRTMRFHFKGKSGQVHDIVLTDRKLAKIVRECQCLPGHELFHFVDDEGAVHKVHSEDVNEYLQEITGEHFTAKDFRTWAGTGQTALELEGLGPYTSETDAKKRIVTAIKNVSQKLGNRPATCRSYYVHPMILEAYMKGALLDAMGKHLSSEVANALRREESCVMELLQAQIAGKEAA